VDDGVDPGARENPLYPGFIHQVDLMELESLTGVFSDASGGIPRWS
jgi:hypothetical protein